METCEITIPSIAVKRGFWIYVIKVFCRDGKDCFYVGMTGDNGYPKAGSMFNRLSKHLGSNRPSSALTNALERNGLLDKWIKLEIFGLYLEKENEKEHREIKREISHIENKLAADFKSAKYKIISNQNSKVELSEKSEKQYQEIVKFVNIHFNIEV